MTERPDQPAPAGAAARLGHVIKRTEQALIAEKSRALREVGLTVPQYAALLTLSTSTGMSGAGVARECMVTPQTMSTILANLEQKGLIEREPSPLHTKVLVAGLTPDGRALTAQADALALEVEGRLAREFSDEEQAQLRGLLERAICALGERPDGPQD